MPMLMYMVKTRSWPVDRFRALLDDVMQATGLTQGQLAAYIPIDQSQLSRWRSGSSKPSYERLVALGKRLEREHPQLGIGPDEILTAAGYTTDTDEASPAEAEEPAPPPSPHPPRNDKPTVEELQAEIDAHLAQMSPEERAKWEQHMKDADRQLELVMMRRRLSFIRLMRGEPTEPD